MNFSVSFSWRHQLWSIVILVILTVSHGVCADVDSSSTHSAQKVVLVTGASTGSGRMIAETLAATGHYVFAGARKDRDLEALNAIENIQSIRLDVTRQSEIDHAVKTIGESGRQLHAIINNAGVGLMAPMIELEEEDLDFILDVNVYGPYRITRAFAPMLIASRGRVVNIGSIAGVQTRTFYGPYSMSKHALEAFTDALAVEMEKFDVKVSIIDPGGFNSNIGKNIFRRMQASGMDFERSLYKHEWNENWILAGGDLSAFKGPEDIVKKVEHALFDPNPQRRYMVVGDPGRAEATMRALLRRMLELNQDHAYTYNRDGLIKLLDEEMARLRQ
jgi:NAD(P)-dependent dehydrogenase (short-subunit alcohol dehydrogenase family)